uniref:CD80-like immunoglobulin C2-set domain-containing protein n=1 Tax=Catharus ustulatus TaxID=91951 RepID=A0A8C3TKU4_CATUS
MCRKTVSTVRKCILTEAKSFLCFYNSCSIFLMYFFILCTVLSCPRISKVDCILVLWKMNCSTCCVLSYRRDINETKRNNCSERITWKYSPVIDLALRIYPVNLKDEGNYTCQIVSGEGNFDCFFSLTVIVPPTVTLTHDPSRVAVCQAAAGKPPADISWIPASNHSSEEEFHHPNGTVTRVSYFGWTNSSIPSVTCLVTHPAMNQTLDLETFQYDFFLIPVLFYKNSLFCFQWVHLGWLPGALQAALLLLPLQQDMLREKNNGQLMGQGEDKERSFTNFCHRQKRLETK